jgi:hypothetical protein
MQAIFSSLYDQRQWKPVVIEAVLTVARVTFNLCH